MPRYSNNPILFDSVNKLQIKKLKEWGYLQPHQIQKGVISWSFENRIIAQIKIIVSTIDNNVILSYTHNNKPINYKIQLHLAPSNLGKGYYYYFICPITKKKARKLYFINGYFLHREAFTNCYYSSQIRSKITRYLDTSFGSLFKQDEIYSEIYSKHFTKYYAGKPTKRYLKLSKEIEKIENVDYGSFERMLKG